MIGWEGLRIHAEDCFSGIHVLPRAYVREGWPADTSNIFFLIYFVDGDEMKTGPTRGGNY